jgi:hypothetical protein
MNSRYYASQAETWEDLTLEERRDTVAGNLADANRHERLKNIYRRILWHPWESLPPDTPDSVDPWDLGSLSASEIEEMVRADKEESPN